MPRPTICTDKITGQIAKYIREGQFLECACGLCDPIISKQDAYNWLKWGEEGKDATGKDKNAYRKFFDAVTRANAEAEQVVVGELRRVATMHVGKVVQGDRVLFPGDPNAARIYLERRFKHWREVNKVEVTGNDGGPVQVNSFPVPVFSENDPVNHFANGQGTDATAPDDAG